MKSFVNALVGGLVVIAAAGIAGVAHNAVRSRPLRLIPNAPPAVAAGVDEVERALGADDAAPEPASPADAVDVAGLKALVDEGAVYVLDARAPQAYAEGHIPGAINIPYDRLPEYLEQLQAEVPVDALVVCYCWSPTCDFSDQLATELRFMGYTDVRVFAGGWEHWTGAGHPAAQGGEE
jgi:rhodanese-related sulfurtransferase